VGGQVLAYLSLCRIQTIQLHNSIEPPHSQFCATTWHVECDISQLALTPRLLLVDHTPGDNRFRSCVYQTSYPVGR